HQSLLGAVLSFVILIGVAFSFKIQTLLKQGTVLFLATFFLGGLLTSLLPFLLKQSDFLFFIFCTSIAFISLSAIHLKWRTMKQEKTQLSFVVDCELQLLQNTYYLKGFIDTGNEAVEPMSQKPVHFLSYQAVSNNLPSEFHDA